MAGQTLVSLCNGQGILWADRDQDPESTTVQGYHVLDSRDSASSQTWSNGRDMPALQERGRDNLTRADALPGNGGGKTSRPRQHRGPATERQSRRGRWRMGLVEPTCDL
eukprot:2491524-Rhodomonas_salina.1